MAATTAGLSAFMGDGCLIATATALAGAGLLNMILRLKRHELGVGQSPGFVEQHLVRRHSAGRE
jgi:hypothetical protein